MTFTFDISVTALLSGAIGGIISQWLAKKVNKNSHQIAIREEKFDDFTNSLNHLRDMLDMVVQSCRLHVLNYDEYNFIVKHNAMELFNRIFDSASKCSICSST